MNIFLKPEQFTGEIAVISESDHVHLTRVMRAKIGQELNLLDGQGNGFLARIEEIGKHQTVARILNSIKLSVEPRLELIVGQALSKGDKLEQVIQHGTEAGAGIFIPIKANRRAYDLPESKLPDRLARWNQIAKGAAEQSLRAVVPKVLPPQTVKEFAMTCANAKVDCLILHPDEGSVRLRTAMDRIGLNPHLALLIGPEGGWSPEEIRVAKDFGVIQVSLGERVLRTETAALVAISQILYHFES